MVQYIESVTSIAYDIFSTLQFELIFSALLFVGFLFSRGGSQSSKLARKGSKTSTQFDASAFLERVAEMCGTKYCKAMELFHSRPTVCFESATPEEYMTAVTSLAVASLRVGQAGRLGGLFARLREREGRDPGLLVTLTRVTNLRKEWEGVWRIVEAWKGIFGAELPSPVLSNLIFSAAEMGDVKLGEELLDARRRRGDTGPEDYMAMVKLYASQSRPDMALGLLEEMEARGIVPDSVTFNIVVGACAQAKRLDTVRELLARVPAGLVTIVTYNTQLKSAVAARDVARGFELLREVEAVGLEPNEVTYGTLVECCSRAGEMEKAQEVVAMMEAKNVPLNAVLYTSMIGGFVAQDRLGDALVLFEQMKSTGCQPDVRCFSVLIKALGDKCRLDEAVELLEELLGQGHVPDEILLNNLLSGCAQVAHVTLAERVWEQYVVRQRLKPTAVTFAMMIKTYCRAGDAQASLRFLERMPLVYSTAPNWRLCMTHVMECVRSRNGNSIVHVAKLMTRLNPCCDRLDQTLAACRKANLLDTAVDLLSIGRRHFSDDEVEKMLKHMERKKKFALLARARSLVEM